MNEERNEKLNKVDEVDEVLEGRELTDDEAKEISGGFTINAWGIAGWSKIGVSKKK